MLSQKDHLKIRNRIAAASARRYEARKPLHVLLHQDKPNRFLRFLAIMAAIAGSIGLVIVTAMLWS